MVQVKRKGKGWKLTIKAGPGRRQSHLVEKVRELRKEMKKAGIKLPPMPRFNSRKVLSGHNSQLLALALA